jgi:hypothetical protein
LYYYYDLDAEHKTKLMNFTDLCQRYEISSGKWLLSVPWSLADQQWKLVKQALVTGKLQVTYKFFEVLKKKSELV